MSDSFKENGPGGCCCGCVPRDVPIADPAFVAESGWTISGGQAIAATGQTDRHLTWVDIDKPSSSGSIMWTIGQLSTQTIRLTWQWLDRDNYRYFQLYLPATPTDQVQVKIGEVVAGVDTIANQFTWALGRSTAIPIRPNPAYFHVSWNPTAVNITINGFLEFCWPHFAELLRDGRVGVVATDTQEQLLVVDGLHTYCEGGVSSCTCVDGWGPDQYQMDIADVGALWGIPNINGTWVLSHTYFKDLVIAGRAYCLYVYYTSTLSLEVWIGYSFLTLGFAFLAYATDAGGGRRGDPYWDTALEYAKSFVDAATDCNDLDHLELTTRVGPPGNVRITAL